MSNITNERLAAIIANPVDIIGITEGLAMARELQLLRASAPVLSEGEREALLDAAYELSKPPGFHRIYLSYDELIAKRRAQASLLRALAQQTKGE